MLRITTIFLNPEHQKQLAAIGKKSYGGLKAAGMTRLAIAQFISRERRKAAAQTVIHGRAKRQSVLGK